MDELNRQFTISVRFPVEPEIIYRSWLHSEEHSLMTGSKASCSSAVGGKFIAWEGYISGKNLELFTNEKIVQAWRTTDFQNDQEDSILEIDLRSIPDGCELILTHSNIPEGNSDYEEGWHEYYFEPMKKYFRR